MFLNDEMISSEKAHQTYNLKPLIQQWLQFKIHLVFYPSAAWNTAKLVKKSFYGNEQKCTYKQCLAGFAHNIILDRIHGYEGLISLAEEKYKGQYSTATIFGRTGIKNFDTIHRFYRDGKLDESRVNDPVFDKNDVLKILNFKIENHRLVIFE